MASDHSGMRHGSDATPFEVFMTSFWNEAADLYLDSFDNALNLFLQCASDEQKRQFARELRAVGQSGFIGNTDSVESLAFWNALGGLALGKDEYMLALWRVAKWSD